MNYILVLLLITITGIIGTYLFNFLFQFKVSPLKYPTIEGFRGYLSFFVFLHHFSDWYFYLKTEKWAEYLYNTVTHCGKTSVIMFFMITGFLFSNKLLDEKPIDWKVFFINRIYRLVPMYFFVVGVVWCIVAYNSKFTLHEPIDTLLLHGIEWLGFIYVGNTNINNWANTYLIIAGVNWSLAYEWLFYFSIPVINVIVTKKTTSWFTVGVCSLLIMVFFMNNHPSAKLLLTFLAGFLVAYVLKKSTIKEHLNKPIFAVLLLILMVFNVYTFSDPDHAIALAIDVLIFLLICSGNTIFGFLTTKTAMVLGQLSYSIYLIHGVILYGLFTYVFDKKWLVSLEFNEYLLLGIGIAPLVIMSSFITHKYIELPFMRFKNKTH